MSIVTRSPGCILSPAGYRMRHRPIGAGRYDKLKPKTLAAQLSALIGQLDLHFFSPSCQA